MAESPNLITGSLWFDSDDFEEEVYTKNKLKTLFRPTKNQEYLGNLDILPTNLAANTEPSPTQTQTNNKGKLMSRLVSKVNKLSNKRNSETSKFISTPFGFSHVAHIDQDTTFGLEDAFQNDSSTAEALDKLAPKREEPKVGYSSFRTTPTGYSIHSTRSHHRSLSAAGHVTRSSSTSSSSVFTRSNSNSTLSTALSFERSKNHVRQQSSVKRLPSVSEPDTFSHSHSKSGTSFKSLKALEKQQTKMACAKSHSASSSLNDASDFQFPQPIKPETDVGSPVSSFKVPSELMHTPSLPGPPTETIPWNSPDSDFFVRQSWIYENIHSPQKLSNASTSTLDPGSYSPDGNDTHMMSLNAGRISKRSRESIRKSFSNQEELTAAFKGLGLDTKTLKMRQSVLLPELEGC